jgi:hypothetical protein
MLKKIIEFIISIFTYKNEVKVEVNENIKEEVKEPEKEPEIVVKEEVKEETKKEYVMLSNRERQTYLKKIGLYKTLDFKDVKIDNIRGKVQKRAEKQFNIIFLNKKDDVYTEETDKLLREFYKSYCESPYMLESDWKYFKDFTKGECKCKCKGKGCNGYPSKIHKRTLMLAQFVRNVIGVPFKFTSFLRCELHNEKVGGVKNSKHKVGRAFDGSGKNKTANEIMKILKEIPFLHYTYQCGSVAVHADVYE